MSLQQEQFLDSPEFEDRVREIMMRHAKDAPVPIHVHNGLDSLKIDQKYLTGQILYPKQFVENATYSADGTDTIQCGFAPKLVFFTGYAENATSGIVIHSNGFAGVGVATEGNTSSIRLTSTTRTGDKRTDRIGGNTSCYIKVTDWGISTLGIQVVVPADYALYSNLLILG